LLIEQVAGDDPQALLPDLERINLSGRHLLDLVESILDLTNIDSGRMELALKPIDVGALVREVVAVARPLILENDNLFEFESDENIDSMIVDPIKLRQILLNLLRNAGKFTANGRVTLSVQKQCVDSVDWIVFRVSDSGIGIPGDHLDQVFELFRQVDDSSTRCYEGSGLGLAISERLCELMGGEIAVESEPGAGSIFTVRLPRQQLVEVSVAVGEKVKPSQAGLPLVEGGDHDGSD
jgi:signal transduction histidine kinase